VDALSKVLWVQLDPDNRSTAICSLRKIANRWRARHSPFFADFQPNGSSDRPGPKSKIAEHFTGYRST